MSKRKAKESNVTEPVKINKTLREQARRFHTSHAWMDSRNSQELGVSIFIGLVEYGFSEAEAMSITTNVLLTAWQYIKL